MTDDINLIELARVDRIWQAACDLVGCPYIWGGHGDTIWVSPEKGLQPISQKLGVNPYGPQIGFDCAGLVTYSLKMAGGPDIQAQHNAATLFKVMPEIAPSTTSDLTPRLLHFYGHDDRITHIAFGYVDLVIEAARGDETTTTWQRAYTDKAKVRVGAATHKNRIGSRLLKDLLYVK